MGKYINNITNKDYLKMNVNKAYDLTIMNPPFTKYKKPKYYLEFLIKAVYDINTNLNKNWNYLIFISPPLIDNNEKEKDTFGFYKILNNISNKDLERCISNLTDKKLNKYELLYLKGMNEEKNNDKVSDDIMEIYDELDMFQCQLIKKCKGFGGTGYTANVYLFMSYKKN